MLKLKYIREPLIGGETMLKMKLHNSILWGIFTVIISGIFHAIASIMLGNYGIHQPLFLLLSFVCVGLIYYQIYKQQIPSHFRIQMVLVNFVFQCVLLFTSTIATKIVGLFMILMISVIQYFALAIPGYIMQKSEKN